MNSSSRIGRAELTVWMVALILVIAQYGYDFAQTVQAWLT